MPPLLLLIRNIVLGVMFISLILSFLERFFEDDISEWVLRRRIRNQAQAFANDAVNAPSTAQDIEKVMHHGDL